MAADRERLERDGCLLVSGAAAGPALTRLADRLGSVKAGARVSTRDPALEEVLSALTGIVEPVQPRARAVRALWFDKTPEANWLVPWHQDRTIAVRERRDAPGFGPWSVKQGTCHVEPPFALLAAMLTVRLHIDDCPVENAPLEVANGSHRERVAAEAAASAAERYPRQLCLAEAGDLWIYRTPILHRSARAAAPRRRRVLQVDFCAQQLFAGLLWAD
ncbi:phytanoyl-CoA dioxygenase family protein [Sandarakinorhabdus sp. AAP62]|uniref:phytanoyl-CoA dioxygenase family protein n=1 Tax=Sandarakinorhabdus sp. AAP62 TaxID=1248916 RepID=UPI00068596D0|nr:phytanoyl-CoA dioxygenase family protein [Sandarakinorhabdus sp. AAP62]